MSQTRIGSAFSIIESISLSDLSDVTITSASNNEVLTYEASSGLWKNKSQLVTSVFGRTGAIVATTNDYTWAQIDKTVSDIADITTKSHTSLTDIGTNTHAQIDTALTRLINTSGTNTGDVSLSSPDNGLSITNQVLALGTPSTCTNATTNSVTTNTHTHAVSGFLTSVTAHNVLSATHGDTTTGSAIRGDIITAQGTSPKWTRLAISVPVANVLNVLGVANGDTESAWKTVLDSTNPTTIGIGDSASPGTSVVFAHRDHQHASPSTWTATAHNLLSAIHGDTLADSVVRGDILIGNSTPKWARLAKGSANAFLKTDGTDVSWSTGFLSITAAKTLTVSNTLTFTGTDSSSVAFGTGGTVAYTANNLSVFAATTSAQLAGVISDETGSDKLVFNTSPTLVTPILGTPQSGTLTSCTGLPISTGVSGLGANVATFLATPSSANLASAITDETGSGALVFGTSPTITTNLTVSGTAPELRFIETDATAGNKNWSIQVTGEDMDFNIVDDDWVTATRFMRVLRTGTTVDEVAYENGKIAYGGADANWPVNYWSNTNALSGTNVTVANLVVGLHTLSNIANCGTGFGFGNTATNTSIGASIIFENTGSYSQGNLHFATKSTATDDATIPIRMTLDYNGNLGIGTVSPATLLEISSTAPISTITNTTAQDTHGGRLGILSFRGTQSGSEVSVLGSLRAYHSGTVDDERGALSIYTNDGNDATSPGQATIFGQDSLDHSSLTAKSMVVSYNLLNWSEAITIERIFNIVTSSANIKALWFFDEAGATATIVDRVLAHTITMTANASTLSPKVIGLSQTIDFNASLTYWDTPDAADLTFGNGTTDSVFSIVVMGIPDTTGTLFAKNDATSGSTQREYNFRITSDILSTVLTDNSANATLQRTYNTSISGDYGSVHTYITTYSASGAATGIKIYRDGVQVDDTTITTGTYVAMEDKTALAGSYSTTSAGAKSLAKFRYGVVMVIAEELTAAQCLRLSNLLNAYGGVAM